MWGWELGHASEASRFGYTTEIIFRKKPSGSKYLQQWHLPKSGNMGQGEELQTNFQTVMAQQTFNYLLQTLAQRSSSLVESPSWLIMTKVWFILCPTTSYKLKILIEFWTAWNGVSVVPVPCIIDKLCSWMYNIQCTACPISKFPHFELMILKRWEFSFISVIKISDGWWVL